ncbi:hypothetical protein [Actinoplanes sp. DH11]|uniref:hypothetical protein n=1 Tax=Actinoplanes sp. DH11 TaxID=2857011 RepID=UPI001E3FE2ED|nr:hypothetical protein [Actinoplanes sp. DH11]
MSNQSVMEKALQFAATARQIQISRAEEVTTFATTTKINQLRDQLEQLRTTLEAARRLNAEGASIDLGKAANGLSLFRKRTAGGVPSDTALNGAITTVSNAGKGIGAAVQQAWTSWSAERLAELRVDRLVMFEGAEAAAAKASLKDLGKLRAGEARAATITQFLAVHGRLRERLDEAPDPNPELLDLLRRLDAGTTLDKLTADDLRLLSEHGLTGTIVVRRRAS